MASSSRQGPPSGVQCPVSARTPTSAAGRRSNTHQRRRPSSRCIAVCQAARTATRGICGHTTVLSPRAPRLAKSLPRSSCRRQTASLCLQRAACPFRRHPCYVFAGYTLTRLASRKKVRHIEVPRADPPRTLSVICWGCFCATCLAHCLLAPRHMCSAPTRWHAML